MPDRALSTDASLVERTKRDTCRGVSSAPPWPEETIRLEGVLGGAGGDRLESAAQRWRTVCPLTAFAAVAHVDMSAVTRIDPAGIVLLNQTYRQVHESGWTFRVTPPADLDARLTFLRAVVGRQLDWA